MDQFYQWHMISIAMLMVEYLRPISYLVFEADLRACTLTHLFGKYLSAVRLLTGCSYKCIFDRDMLHFIACYLYLKKRSRYKHTIFNEVEDTCEFSCISSEDGYWLCLSISKLRCLLASVWSRSSFSQGITVVSCKYIMVKDAVYEQLTNRSSLGITPKIEEENN